MHFRYRLPLILFVSTVGGTASVSTGLADPIAITIDQVGNTQTAHLTQISGQGNIAGDDSHPITQTGVDNTLTITQTGSDNSLGLSGGGVVQAGTASIDGSASNSATIMQESIGNTIGAVAQTSGATHATTSNTLSVLQQHGGYNTITAIDQIQSGSGNSANTATIIQNGLDNWIDRIDQAVTTGDGDNEIYLEFTGERNGINPGFDAPGTLGVLALSAGARSGRIVQGTDLTGGGGNVIRMVFTGNDNQFGIYQRGTRNTLGMIQLGGQGNSFGASQLGSNNIIAPSGISGDDNDIGISQTLDQNYASVSLANDSSRNEVGLGQLGTLNSATLTLRGDDSVLGSIQLGYHHAANLAVTGSDDLVVGVQVNAGYAADTGNTMTVSVNGSRNNRLSGGGTPGFTGGALAVASLAPLLVESALIAPDASLLLGRHAGAISLMPGLLVQSGEGNTMQVAVGAVAAASDNLFAAAQYGTANTATLSVQGNANQAAIVQVGDNNSAGVVQAGDDDNAGILQYGVYNVAMIRQ